MIGVLVEHGAGGVSGATLEVLTAARALGTPAAIWLGDVPSADAVARLGEYGAVEVRVAEIGVAAHLPSAAAVALEAALGDVSLLLGVSTFAAKEIVTRLAVSTGAGVVVDASAVELVDGHPETTQTVFTATWLVRTRIDADRAVVLLRPNSTLAAPAPTPVAPEVVTVPVDLPVTPETLVSRVPAEAEGVPLAEAAVVVSGGRGTRGDYALVSELAALLGGAVGATRDATDEGWISHEHMVGQTGTTVSPALYVACGISGAVYHRGGMQGSGTIVAINVDPDAPIFEIADFGVVGDLFEVLPQALAVLQRRK